ncbi:MAG TPA: Glu-tRNA(Gln) amidotransferase subunit GatE, partial [Thermoprotei archaeon]|nr:Glu-tRNA(Gln) amidotransferase subunit GatE [Thermoprotei archaeon]
MTEKIDWENIGLKCGMEFHQMLNTKHKLFCKCPTIIRRDNPHFKFERILRPTMSEMGEIDQAALFEFKRHRFFEYEGYNDTTCLVEMDEEPPHNINEEAVKIALEIALLLNAQIVDEIQVMRKIVIDGSNTSGFQRTALIAFNGWINISNKKIRINTICLEEDAARKIEERGEKIIYRLDRLGIPLIEIATSPDISSPEEAQYVALKIGQLLRITGKVKRGLGTIRQDLNISVKGGRRVEIKGVQQLHLIKKVVEYEALRQISLIKISKILKERGLTYEDLKRIEYKDLTNLFSSTKSKLIKKILKRNGRVIGIRMPMFKGILGYTIQPGRRFGTEFADRVRAYTKLKGILHSDELPGYGICKEEVELISKELGLKDTDAFILVVGEVDEVYKSIPVIIERAKEALEGVPSETRAINPDGTTHFTRPIPGAARMYPETDIRPYRISSQLLEEIKKSLPETPEEKFKKFVEEYHLSEEQARKMITSYYLDIFEKIVENINVAPSIVATTLEGTLRNLRREGVDIDNISDEHLFQIFKALSENKIAKEAIPKILEFFAKERDASIDDAITRLGLEKVSIEEVRKIVLDVINTYKD